MFSIKLPPVKIDCMKSKEDINNKKGENEAIKYN